MKISPIHGYVNLVQPQKNNNTKENTDTFDNENKNFVLRAKFNDYMLSFGARVDKGLERFYDVNKDRMPYTVKTYIDTLPDKKRLTPLDAQRNAFKQLEQTDSIDEIKELFPDEVLFKELKNPEDTKASRGILRSLKEDDELLKLSGIGALKDKTNLTVYLVKKIFLEAKTIEEINKDLENDLEPDFKADFKFKNPDSPYIYPTTLKALGIKMPISEYQQSLRYTRDGYSDMVGEIISKAQIEFWNALTNEERTSRAKKSVENFEIWWDSHTRNEKLDLIAQKESILEMLKEYKKTNRANYKKITAEKKSLQEQSQKNGTHSRTKVGSSVLSQDELFKIWASKNLQIFEESLSEAERDTLHLKRMNRLAQRWKEMSPEEKTEFISKMKSGAEPAKYTMIDAWNHSIDLIQLLSSFLKENQIYKPADLLYSTQEFSEFQSKIMTEFWQTYPDYAQILGEKVKESGEKVEAAIQNGTFEELKKQIMRDKNQRIKELAKNKTQTVPQNTNTQNKTSAYKDEFKAAYNLHMYGKPKSLPKNFYNDMYAKVLDIIPEDAVKAWTKSLLGKQVTEKDRILIAKYVAKEIPEVARYNRALEAAMADTIYELTKNPDAYRLSNSDVKVVMFHFERGEDASIVSHKTGEQFDFEIINNKRINPERINYLYENYKKDLTEDEINRIIHTYFTTLQNRPKDISIREIEKMLSDYLQSYGKSVLILFSTKSTYPVEVKAKFNEKFLANMPDELNKYIKPIFNTQDDIERDNKLRRAVFMYTRRFDFLPSEFKDVYADEMMLAFNNESLTSSSLDKFIQRCCTKRKDTESTVGIAVIPKLDLTFKTQLTMLAMEQALADVLYDATGNEEVYSLELEKLCDNIELFNLVKKFPMTSERKYSGQDGKEISLIAHKKLNLHKIKPLYNEYLDEINQWLSEWEDSEDDFSEDILYILNPQENNPQRDINTAKRMARYGLNPPEFTIYPNR